MALVKLKVSYADGREVEAVASPQAQVMTEEFIGFGEEHKVKAGYYLAWASLHCAGMESAEFGNWLKAITEVEEVGQTPVNPTQPDQSAASSSD